MQPDYGFIMNPGSGPQKKSLLPAGLLNLSKKQLILLGAGGAVFLAIIVTILFSVFGGGPTNKDQLLDVAARQSELIRVSDIALKEATGTQARNLAQTTKLSLRSDQSTLTAALKAQKVKIPKTRENTETTQMLTEAKQSNRFDEVFLEFVQEELVEYQRTLNTAYQTTVDSRLKETMKMQYQNASVIIGVDPEV
jgi:hypothetical protein